MTASAPTPPSQGQIDRESDRVVRAGKELVQSRQVQARASYRIQFDPRQCRFTDAAKLVGYLDALGISHLYTSPHLKPRPGSSHGYDVVDHGSTNPELGTEAELAEVHDRLREKNMSMLVDWVPNHMGTGHHNALWMDVLENGPSSVFARYFDVDWRPLKSALADKMLVPILGDQYGVILEKGELKLAYERGSFEIRYWDHRFPVSIKGYGMVLSHDLAKLSAELGVENTELHELQSIITSIQNLPARAEAEQSKLAERRREKEVIKRRLAALTEASAPVRAHVERSVEVYNGQANKPESLALLDQLLTANAYRLAYWRVAGEEINYRRFFDINELIALRMEDPEVFRATHRLMMQWIAKGWIRALRIDHPDGLYDPTGYFRRLQAHALLACCHAAHTALGAEAHLPWEQIEAAVEQRCFAEVDAAGASSALPIWVTVEKILARKERLPAWAVNGTTGYDFLNSVNGLFVDREGESILTTLYGRVSNQKGDFSDMVSECKRVVLQTAFAPEVQVLAHRLVRIAEGDYRTRDFTLGSLTDALTEIIAFFPVYRTYVAQGDEKIDERDRQYIEQAIARGRRRSAATSSSVFDFIRDVLLKVHPQRATPAQIEERLAFVGKFQQLTPPSLAKGMEDTAFYRYNRLISQNEVGGEPEHWGSTPGSFHAQNRERARTGSSSLLSTTTHDTKRGEDARLRIDALSELPTHWRRQLAQWVRMNRRLKTELDGRAAPDRNDEYLFYQTLIGVWPGGTPSLSELQHLSSRVEEYMIKAAREAKLHSSWINPATAYEEAVRAFVRGVIMRPMDDPFWATFTPLAEKCAWAAAQASLAQVVLKVASPGVPDFYQGAELWDLRLVDPDNRGPVDFAANEKRLDALIARATVEGGMSDLVRELAANPLDPTIKLFTTWRCLQMRRRYPDVFSGGEYAGLDVAGPRAGHVVALTRSNAKATVVAVVGRLFARMREEITPAPEGPGMAVGAAWWETTRVVLPSHMTKGRFRDQITGKSVALTNGSGAASLAVADVLGTFPVALLEWQPGS